MGRKSKEELTDDARAISLVAQEQRDKESEIKEADRLYLASGESYSLNACMERAKIHQKQMSDGMLGLGEQLLLMKAHEGHGQFMAILDELNMKQSSANYAMAAVRKFGNSQSIGNLGVTKIYALTVLDDDDVRSLVEKDELPGVGTLDEIDRMSVRELKAALREERDRRVKDREAQEAAIAKKEKKLNEMESRLRYQEPPTKEKIAQSSLDSLRRDYVATIAAAHDYIRQVSEIISRAQKIECVSVDQLDAFIHANDEIVRNMDDDYQALMDMMENIRPVKTKK